VHPPDLTLEHLNLTAQDKDLCLQRGPVATAHHERVDDEARECVQPSSDHGEPDSTGCGGQAALNSDVFFEPYGVFTAAVGQVAAGGLGDQGVTADLVAKVGRVGHLVKELAAARERVLEKAAGR